MTWFVLIMNVLAKLPRAHNHKKGFSYYQRGGKDRYRCDSNTHSGGVHLPCVCTSSLEEKSQYCYKGVQKRMQTSGRDDSSMLLLIASLIPRSLPDFISQPWRKIGRRPGSKTTSRTGNGGLGQYVTWTRFVLTESTISGP